MDATRPQPGPERISKDGERVLLRCGCGRRFWIDYFIGSEDFRCPKCSSLIAVRIKGQQIRAPRDASGSKLPWKAPYKGIPVKHTRYNCAVQGCKGHAKR